MGKPRGFEPDPTCRVHELSLVRNPEKAQSSAIGLKPTDEQSWDWSYVLSSSSCELRSYGDAQSS
jgi:hypothetical protein